MSGVGEGRTHGDVREAISRGHTIRYRVAGSGPPLLLLPGMGGRAEMWFQDGYVDVFERDFTVLAPDVLGHGLSDKPHDPAAYREPDVALDALAVLDAEGIDEPVRVWGYSRGARLGYMLATETPERVRCLIAGATPLGIPPALVSQFMAPVAAPLLAEDWDAYWETFGVPVEPEFRGIFESDSDMVALGCVVQAMADAPYEFDVDRIDVPCLLYVGGEDPFATFVEQDAAALGAPLEVLRGMSHMEGYTRLDLIAPRARAFLEDH